MKRGFIICLFALTLLAVLAINFLVVPVSAQNKPADPNSKVLVTVNGEDINEGTMKLAVPLTTDMCDSETHKISQTYIDQQRSNALDTMITNMVILQQLTAKKITVTSDEVDNNLKIILSASEPPMTLEELKVKFEESGPSGMTFEQWKELNIKNKMLMERLLTTVYPEQMNINDAAAKKYYDENPKNFQQPEQVRASHILIRIDSREPNKVEQNKALAMKKAKDILEKIRKGAEFSDMAKMYSEDTVSAKNGGDLGYFDRSRMIKEFADAAFSLKVGQVSDIVPTSYGFHIIKLIDHKDASVMPFEKIKLVLIDGLKSQKMDEIAGPYIQKIRDEAKIVYPPDSELRAYRTSKTQIKQAPMPAGMPGQPLQGAAVPPKQPTTAPK